MASFCLSFLPTLVMEAMYSVSRNLSLSSSPALCFDFEPEIYSHGSKINKYRKPVLVQHKIHPSLTSIHINGC